MAQLWVNLRARDKNAPAGYQTLLDRDIPPMSLPGDAGPARTFAPMDVWDVRMRAGRTGTLDLPQDRTVAVILLRGNVAVDGGDTLRDGQLVLLDRGDGGVALTASAETTLLILSGEPIDEPRRRLRTVCDEHRRGNPAGPARLRERAVRSDRLTRAFENTIKAIEARNGGARKGAVS